MCTWNNSLCCVEHFGRALHAWRDRGARHSVAGMSVLPSPLPSTWDGGGLGGRSTNEYLIGKPTSQSTTSAASSKRCAVALEHARARACLPLQPTYAYWCFVRSCRPKYPPVWAASSRSRRRSCHTSSRRAARRDWWALVYMCAHARARVHVCVVCACVCTSLMGPAMYWRSVLVCSACEATGGGSFTQREPLVDPVQ